MVANVVVTDGLRLLLLYLIQLPVFGSNQQGENNHVYSTSPCPPMTLWYHDTGAAPLEVRVVTMTVRHDFTPYWMMINGHMVHVTNRA